MWTWYDGNGKHDILSVIEHNFNDYIMIRYDKKVYNVRYNTIWTWGGASVNFPHEYFSSITTNTIAADDLATQGTKAAEAMVLIKFPDIWYIWYQCQIQILYCLGYTKCAYLFSIFPKCTNWYIYINICIYFISTIFCIFCKGSKTIISYFSQLHYG